LIRATLVRVNAVGVVPVLASEHASMARALATGRRSSVSVDLSLMPGHPPSPRRRPQPAAWRWIPARRRSRSVYI